MEWKEVRLGDIAEVNIGRTPPRKKYQWFNNPQRAYKWVSIKDMGACGKYIYDTSETITQEGQKKFNIPIVPPRTILLSFKLTVGRLAITGDEEMLTNEAIAQLPIINDQIIDKDYLYYYLKSFRYESLGNTSSIATAVNSKTIKELPVLYPPLATQRRISSILSSLDRKIELNNKINATLEELAQTLFKSWFVDFEPFKNGKFIETEIGEIPEGWRVEAFEDFLKATTEKTGVEGIPEYSVTNTGIHPRDGKFNKSLSKSSAKNKLLRKGNLVFGMSREILNWGIMKEEIGGVSSAYNIYIVDESKVPTLYLELFIKHRMDYFHDLIKPASREGQGLDKAALMSKFIYLPSEEAYKRFLEVYEPLVKQASALSQETLTLTHLRDTLLPRLMSGEIEL